MFVIVFLCNARYQSAVMPHRTGATAASPEDNAWARVASRVSSGASCGRSPASSRQPGRPPQRALNAWTSSATERKLCAFGARLTAAGARFGSATIRLRQHQIARQRVEHVLPGPYGLGIAQRDRLSRFEGPDDVVHDPER